ncbi:protocadherin-like wing polarity protein stan isoform X2 [Zeugodacus cucurbitae]|uniref:protocadherin-like wing polarity protein stan isoform X2 n=1 Tax=Zeugodacus cucurbitae TaxID=28588 RepID=UPI0023D905C0|nr:protocadherin-like wing polarity protein stan isoform X2 [Zeugodacus cucurbitae]
MLVVTTRQRQKSWHNSCTNSGDSCCSNEDIKGSDEDGSNYSSSCCCTQECYCKVSSSFDGASSRSHVPHATITTPSTWLHHTYLLLFLLATTQLLHSAHGYLIIVHEDVPAGTVVFNASVYKLGSERHYKINAHKSAHFVHHLVAVNHKDGQIQLRKQLKCDGIYYPNLFTFYVDSTSTRLRSIDYYSLPVRIFVTGRDCNEDRRIEEEMHSRHYEEEETGYSKRRRRYIDTIAQPDLRYFGAYLAHTSNSVELTPSSTDVDVLNHNNSRREFRDGDLIFGDNFDNDMRHRILSRKRRAKEPLQLEPSLHRRISDAKQWISETYASYAIHTTDKWNQICLRRSQFINNLNAFLPKSICQHCKVNFLDVNDERFAIEHQNHDLVASRDVCIHESMWKVSITFNIRCNRNEIVDSDHRLKIVYHYQEFNDTDIAKRVRRELRNQSPYFEQALYVASVLEEQPAGSAVTTVRARDPEDSPVVYSMVSLLDSRSQSLFKVDSRTGVVTTSASLDRELMDVHYFRVVATDDSFPPRSGTTTLQVNVLDCNDHSPTFEAEQFEASIREGATVGSTVITLRATDQDIGKNAEIEYGIESVTDGTGTLQDQELPIFRIDARSGVISTRSTLDRETSDSYNLIVTASDMASAQSERKTATATVIVKILDDNDNYPQFSERTYTVQVPEDQWGDDNVVAHIRATDADQGNNAAIRYAIIGGNTQSQFSIDSMSGDVSLVKPLDYESVRSYRLVIRAQDGGSPSRSNTTQLLVNVIDTNDNAPRFYTSQFQESVLENVPVGYNIIRVQAYDADEGANAEIAYSISERDDNFPLAVDSRTGWVQTIKPLDREEQSRYTFQVVAKDGGVPPKSASSTVVITVQDVNDNDPTFNPKYYEANVGEDQPPGTPVVTVTATDPDEDSRLHYELTSGNTRGRFAITSQNGRGLITIAQSLDYKQEKRFVLTVTATDSGGRSDTATVNINITDANNFAPIFENAPYSASVFEDAPIGTTVLVVSATDSDVGINAQITYSLNEESINGLGSPDPFSINPQTGAIVTNALLDRETTSGYLLTVTAKDGGNPSLSDTTDVEISVTDVNDNPPVFKNPLYQASILEDALVGTSVIQVSATDPDIGLNGRIKYLLSDRDVEDGSFVIDPTSGTIRTNKGLDRESVATYHLTAIAVDKGSPPLSSTVEVQIRLEDVNDSPPTFPSDKITLYVPENSPVGSVVGEIHAHDPDEGVNAVVHYSIIGGDDSNSFSLVTRPGSERAQLLTMTELDYESNRKRFELVIRAASPPLRNDAHVEILVTDVNDNAPVLRDFQVIFNNFRDHFPSGEIGRIPATDADVTDKLTYRILSGNNANLLRLNTTSGGLILSPQLNTNVPKFATMEVSVSDGINEAKAIMQLSVRLITEDMLFNSVTVRLNEMTEEAFLSPLLNFFLDGLAAIIPCPKENIFVFSIQDDTDVTTRILNVSFSAKRPDVSHEEFYTPQYLQERVYLNRAILARLATVEVLPFDDNLCVREPCLNFEECLTVLKFGNASEFIHSDTVLFRPIYPVNTFACSCPEGFTGSKEHYLCDTEVDLCYSDPCRNGGTCVRREGGYTCICSPKHTGVNCETDISTLKPCMSDACDGGYSCMNSFLSSQPPPYTATCELRSRSFSKNSFLTFESLKQRHRFNLKLRFSTVHENGLLLYNGRYNELHDFIALEILEGHVSFSYSLGDNKQSVTVVQQAKVSDGEWHDVEVIYFNRTVTLVLDKCDTAIALAGNLGDRWSCANQTTLKLDKRCALLTETCHRFLDLTGPLQLGGLPRIPAHFPVENQDFIGCISDLRIDERYIDLNSYVADNGTISGCPQKAPLCSSEPCFNGGVCREGWNTYTCECPEGYAGNACQETIPAPWRFSGDGSLSFNPLLRPIQLPWVTSLSMRTLQLDAFLLQIQIGQNSSAVLCLKNGILYYIYDNEPMYLAGAYLSDGNWHRIEVKWLGSEVQFSVDYGQRTGVVPMSQKVQGLYVGKIVIGSADGSIGVVGDMLPFEGCIQNVRIGASQSVLSRPTIRENVEDGCMSRAECPESCPPHSTCTTTWDQSQCECLPGYVGPDCLPICTVKPCTAGVCRANTSEPRGYKCECNSSLQHGEYCEKTVQQPCPGGWWGEKVCGPCKCNLKQGYHPDCNKTTGQCYCKTNHYQPPNETACIPCDCYSIGSFSSACNRLTGQCECREGVIGRRCDSCSNPYAEVTLNGCEVVYDACPRSFAAGIWWPRTPLGSTTIENCPSPARGKGQRTCDGMSGGWNQPDMFNCTSDPFVELRKQLSQLEKLELELNSFVAIKMVENLQLACETVDRSSAVKKKLVKDSRRYKMESSFLINEGNNMWSNELEMDYLSDELKFTHDRLYGADLLVTEGILQEIINYELMQNGLNLTHSQDKYFIKNLVDAASVILDRKYAAEWKRATELIQRGPDDLVDAFNKYMVVLASSQHDTYTNPFEIVQRNMIFALDIITTESLFGYEPEQLSEYHKTKLNIKPNAYTTESVILPDTSGFLQHSSKQKPVITFPKYNNYIQDKTKFDKYTKVLVPLDMLGITPPGSNEVTQNANDYRAIISYAQYKDVGQLLPDMYDETITRRWGVDIEVASPILSLAILVPSSDTEEKRIEIPYRKISSQKIDSNEQQFIEVFDVPKTSSSGSEEHMIENIRITAHEIMPPATSNSQETSAEVSSNEAVEVGDGGDEPHISVRFDDENIEFHGDTGEEVVDSPEVVNPHFDVGSSEQQKGENEAIYRNRRLVKRQVEVIYPSEQQQTQQNVIYRSLGSPHLSQPIKLQMWLDVEPARFGPRSNPQCVRWNSFTSQWTRLGCQTEVPDFDELPLDGQPIIVNCTCTHVSNYAVIVDIIDPEDIPEPSLLVQITSYSAFMVSLPVLLSVLIALALLRGQQTNSNTIHQNIVLCVFCAELLFFVGMQSRRNLLENEFPCKLIAICLHYFWLAAFAWTTVDCVHLYRMLTEMRDINHGPMGFYFAMGYGAPAIVVGLSVGVRAHEYGNSLFCWLSVYEPVVWWLVGPIAGMSVVNLLILFVSVKAAFTLKDHVLGFGNLRTLLWLSVVSLPLMGVMWVLAVLAASENSQMLSILLSGVVVLHSIFCLIGYCIINKRVRENLQRTFLRCMGRKVPLLDSSLVVSNSSHNVNGATRPNNFLAGSYDTARRNVGISVSSTTSRSTAKTSSSPYSDGQLRQTSTSTSNYNSASDAPSFLRGFDSSTGGGGGGGRREEKSRRHRKDSDSGSETDGRSLELASSHSSDDDESRTARSSGTHRSTGVSATPSYLPNITEHVQATTPPELNVVQSPQLFPSVNKPVYAPRWSSQLPDAYLQSPANVGRWSQETGSDNEHVHGQKVTISPNPLPNPDLTDTSYLQQHHNKINMPPSILENLQNVRNDNGYDTLEHENLYRRKEYQDSYGQFDTLPVAGNYKPPSHYGSEKDYNGSANGSNSGGGGGGNGGTQIVNHMRSFHPDAAYLSDSIYDKQRTLGYMGPKAESPYMSKERIAPDIYGSRENHYSLKKPHMYVGTADSMHSVHSLLKNDYQAQQQRQHHLQQQQQLQQQHQQHQPTVADYHSDRMSEGSDKNGYHFPYTAEEDHIPGARKLSHQHNPSPSLHSSHQMLNGHAHGHAVNDMNNPGMLGRHTLNSSSRHGSRTSSPPSSIVAPMQPLAPLTSITDTDSELDIIWLHRWRRRYPWSLTIWYT